MNGSLRVYIVEGAGCGGCAQEARAMWAARHGAIRQGVVAVEVPAHADVLVLCGPMPRPLAEEVQQLARLLHEPWACVRLGECAEGEVLAGREVFVPGCPPGPQEILAAVRAAWEGRGTVQPQPPRSSAGEGSP